MFCTTVPYRIAPPRPAPPVPVPVSGKLPLQRRQRRRQLGQLVGPLLQVCSGVRLLPQPQDGRLARVGHAQTEQVPVTDHQQTVPADAGRQTVAGQLLSHLGRETEGGGV